MNDLLRSPPEPAAKEPSRRDVARGALSVVALLLVGCDAPLLCTDTSQLSPADVELRERTLGYVDRSPDVKRTCSGCQQFKPHGEKTCGACVVVRGPVNPAGRCQKWAGKAG